MEPSREASLCEHQERHNRVRDYIEADDIVMVDRGRGFEGYDYEVARVGRGSQATDRCGITHFSEAHKVYGSEVVASCLIHELGHCQQFRQGKNRPAGRQENIEYEEEANRLGREVILQVLPPDVLPADYEQHRAFFLRSYSDSEQWTREKTLSEWAVFRNTLKATPLPD